MTLPLSLPGVATGSMLVFILLMGEFIIPALLGGGKVFFIGNALVDLFLQSRNWPFGAAVSVAMVVVMLVTVVVYMRFVLGRSGAPPRGAGLRRGGMRVYASLIYALPLRADRAHRRLQLQCRPLRHGLAGLFDRVVSAKPCRTASPCRRSWTSVEVALWTAVLATDHRHARRARPRAHARHAAKDLRRPRSTSPSWCPASSSASPR